MSGARDIADLAPHADDLAAIAVMRAEIEAILANGGGDTGDIKPALRATASTGWLLLNGDTIGDASSGADHAGAAYEALFVNLYESLADAQAPVSGGRGANAAADWAAHKTLTLPNGEGAFLVGAGGAVLLGGTGGSADAVLIAHLHDDGTLASNGITGVSPSTSSVAVPGGESMTAVIGVTGTGTATISGNTGTAGSGNGVGANLPPYLAVNWQIKL